MTTSGSNFSEVCVIVRSGGERTVAGCRRLFASQAPEAHLEVVREIPFSAALRESFARALAANRKWTLTVDGDILPHVNGLGALIEFADTLPADCLLCQGLVIDKLFGNKRQAGVHLYRTELLPQVTEEFTGEVADSLRPETNLKLRMDERGHGFAVFDGEIAGLHDYRQYFRDLYRKAFVHARKNSGYIRLLLPRWEALAEEDADFRIALIGYRAGIAFPHDLPIDLRVLPTEILPILECLGLDEKSDLGESEVSATEIEDLIAAFEPFPGTGLLQQRLGIRRDNSAMAKLRDIGDAVGWGRVLPWLIGSKLRNSGRRMVNWAERENSSNRASEDNMGIL